MTKVIAIVGPTAVGKTALGIKLAREFDGEIISGDSQQVYRGLDIGTAKATAAEQAAAVHHLIDTRALTENFSAHDFVLEANETIKKLSADGKVPIIVGGTGLYIQALIEGYHLGGEKYHAEMQQLRDELSLLTDAELYQLVADRGLEIPEINRRRAIRALELAAFPTDRKNQASSDEFLLIGLTAPRELLYARINARVDKMMTDGLLAEATMLYETAHDVQAAKGIGYKEFFPYLAGELSLNEAIEKVKQNSRHYAKRQLTWFRNRMAVDFVDTSGQDWEESVIMQVRKFLE